MLMMDVKDRNSHSKKSSSNSSSCTTQLSDQEEVMMGATDLRRGPWTVEEDFKLMNYIANHGEGRWNSLARSAGLKRTGKSCRLRWLNYLRPDVRRGNITLEEQLMILELHSRWGNRWSKIAQHLPGRTDNEIKNYWRTRVQKHAKQLKCDVNSKQFKDAMRYLWMPRLIEKIQAASTTTTTIATANTNTTMIAPASDYNAVMAPSTGAGVNMVPNDQFGLLQSPINYTSEKSSADYCNVNDLVNYNSYQDYYQANNVGNYTESLISPTDNYFNQGLDFQAMEQNNQWLDGVDISDNLWNVEDVWFSQQQHIHNM